MDWFDLLAVLGTLKSLLQHQLKSINSSIGIGKRLFKEYAQVKKKQKTNFSVSFYFAVKKKKHNNLSDKHSYIHELKFSYGL